MITEKELHKQICTYIKLQYPNVLFNTDMSGIKLTMGQAVQAKKLRSGNGFPDIMIFETKDILGCAMKYGLFLEVKKESPYRKDLKLKKNAHLEEQFRMHTKLNFKGYIAQFVWTFDIAKDIIDNYLKN